MRIRESAPMLRAMRVAVRVALFVAGLFAGCRHKDVPQDRVLVVKTEAPVLSEPEDDEAAATLLRAGAVAISVRPIKPIHWVASAEGRPMTRDAMCREIRLTPGGGRMFVFDSDFEEGTVPAASFVCGTLPAASPQKPSCTNALGRIVVAPGKVVAWVPCRGEKCPIGIVDDGNVRWSTVDDLFSAEKHTIAGRDVLFVLRRWVKAKDWTGATATLLDARTLAPLGDVPLESTDARTQTIASRTGKVSFEGDAIRFRGTAKEIDRATGNVSKTEQVDETWRLRGDALVHE